MNHLTDVTSLDISDEQVTLVGDAREDGFEANEAGRLASEADCEITALSEAAGIDSSSLTDEQIMEALYQMG